MKVNPSWIEDFSGGVITGLAPTRLPSSVSPYAYNTALRPVQGGTLQLGKRPGYAFIGRTSGAVNSTIVDSAFFHYEEQGVITTHHIGVDSDGKIWELKASPTQLTIPTGTFGFPQNTLSGVSAGIQFVPANNQLFGWVRGALPFKIYRKPSDSTLYVGKVGLPAPTAPTLNTALAGNLSGVVDIHVTYYNSASGVESSASADLTKDIDDYGGGATRTLRINLPTTGPAEVDKLRVYLRKRTLQTDFARNDAMEVALGTATIDLSFTDAQLNQLILLSPDTAEHNPPPSGVIAAHWHLSRMFVTDGKYLYYSELGNGDQYDPQNQENPGRGDGQRLAGFRSLDKQTLALFKERSIWGLIGESPQTWQLDTLVPNAGTISTLSLAEGDGLIAFWSENGPMLWDKTSEPKLLVNETLKVQAEANRIYLNRRDKTRTVFDPIGHRFLWRLDTVSASDPWSIAPFSTRYGCWEALAWDLGPVTSLTVGPSSYAEQRVFFGGADRTLYELAQSFRTDAAASESGVLVGTVLSGTVNAVTLLSSGPYAVNPYGSVARLISAGTLAIHRSTYSLVGTTLTWTTPSAFVPAAGDIVVFDAPVLEYETPSMQEGSPDRTHRLLQTYAEMATNADTPILLGVYRDNETTLRRVWKTVIARNRRDSLGPGGSLAGTSQRHKRWAGFLCLHHRFRLVLWYPLAEHALSRIGWLTDVQGDEDA